MVDTVASKFFSEVRTRNAIEPVHIFNDFPKLESVPKNLRLDYSRIVEKPFFFLSQSWSTATARNSIISNVSIPQDLMVNNMIKVPFYNSSFYRTKLEIILQTSGTPMHQGTILAAAVPSNFDPGSSFETESCVATLMACPHVFLSANNATAAKLEVPFYYNYPLINSRTAITPNGDALSYIRGTKGRYAQLVLFVLNPLVAPTSGSTSLSINMFAQFIDSEFYVPYCDINQTDINPPTPPTFSTQGLEAIATSTFDSLAAGAKKVTADIIDVARSTLRQYTGLHNPNQPRIAERVIVSNVNLPNNVDLQSNYNKLDPFTDFDRITNDSYFLTKRDEMDMKSILSKPYYIGSFKVEDTQTPGKLLFARPISPLQCKKKGTDLPYVSTPLEIFYTMSRYWRGSLNVHIQSNMSNFHFCRLMLVRDYTPKASNATKYPTYESVANMLTTTLEFSGGGQVQTVNLPYCSQFEHKICTNDFVYNSIMNGMYYIYLQQNLVTNGSISKSIEFNVYLSAGEDFQYYGYSTYSLESMLTSPPSFKSQEEENEDESLVTQENLNKEIEGTFKTQSAEVSFQTPSQTALLSTNSLERCTNIKDDQFRPIVSVRDYSRRMIPVLQELISKSKLAANQNIVAIPVARLLGFLTDRTNRRRAHQLTLLSSLFLGYNGGVKFRTIVTGATASCVYYIPPDQSYVPSETQAVSSRIIRLVNVSENYLANDVNINTTNVTPLNAIRTYYDTQTRTEGTSKPYTQTMFKDVEDYSKMTVGNLIATSDTNGIYNNQQVFEFVIPNLNNANFIGTWQDKLSETRSSTATDLGQIIMFLTPHVKQPDTKFEVDSDIHYEILAGTTDEGRYGFQVTCGVFQFPTIYLDKKYYLDQGSLNTNGQVGTAITNMYPPLTDLKTLAPAPFYQVSV